MRLLRASILPLALGLILGPAAWAGDDDKKSSDKKGDEQTIRGVVSEVTVMGETDVDFTTGKAITAEATFLTIVGHPSHHDAMHKEGGVAAANQDKDVKRTSTEARSGENPRHRMNVYVVAVSPKTKVCECKETGKEGASSVKEEPCSLEKLEIGDRVEISFNPKTSRDSSKDNARTTTQKHGRHRTFFGMANDIKILTEPAEAEHAASSLKK